MLDSEYNMEETISYGKMRGWSERKILVDVKLRISLGEDINQQKDGGATPLMSAAASGYFSIVQVLLDSGANVLLKNRWKEDSISCAKLSEKKEIIDLLVRVVKEKSGSTGLSTQPVIYFRPKVKKQAEYTFIPTKNFKAENKSSAKDVGFFLNSTEILKLNPIKVPVESLGVLKIYIAEGTISINIGDWTELSEKKVEALIDKSSVDIHDINNVINEYLSE